MKKNIFTLILMFNLIVIYSAEARTMFGSARKSGNQNARWTLADWVTQKKEFKMMDQWLAINKTKDLFELNVSGGQSSYDYEVSGNIEEQTIDYWSVSAYWSIFGLKYTDEKSDEDWKRTSTQLNVRLFGTSSTDTYLEVMGGLRSWKYANPANTIDQTFAGAKLNIYLLSFFGIDGEYKKYLKASDSSNVDYESERIEYGAFLDLYFVRVYGGVYKETDAKDDGSTSSEETREGTQFGAQFYF
jgi:hypothetical protein